ncbi:CLUMA_CG002872, isoform A [Clunio marinus]|uniref:CLUMA_CG002872, isoform A n=1 Tax=Clunio marinus TaxID=568069 RepID=A0A1J1HL48_9DIPT|nr:CLUMA_CG002872, isoform A [Clunio marinus]
MVPTFKGDIKEYKPFKESMTTALERMELSTLSTRKLQTRMGNGLKQMVLRLLKLVTYSDTVPL